MNMLLILNILQTTLLLIIAAGVAYLIYRSSRGVRGSRKSLHSRRREIYDDLMRILATLGKTGELRKEELLDFRLRTLDAALVFDTEIAEYIDEIYARGVTLMNTHEVLKGEDLHIGEKRDDVTVENAKQTIWLADQLAMVAKKFNQYPEVK
ncbi:MAG: hypothetical protein M0R70_10205 [Nitrospirae bacterium]|nr:hypothetical protein [Nitrospirota bacterium]